MRTRVLVVDDDPHIQDLLSLFLEQAGFEVQIRKDGYSALGELVNKPYDLVILDIAMPHVNGLNVLKKMKKNDQLKDLPVLMLTSSRDRGDVEQALGLGVTDYIIKPPQKKDLLKRVERVLGGSPQFVQVAFKNENDEVAGTYEAQITLHSISRKGMVLSGSYQLEQGDVLPNLSIPLLNDKIGVKKRNFAISECHIENDVFNYTVSFIQLNEEDQKKVSEWITQESFERKSKGQKVR